MLDKVISETEVESAVNEVIAEVMVARGLDPNTLIAEAKLADGLGLKSMDLAEIVLTLEDRLDADPFQKIAITSIRKVEDLTGAYLAELGLAEAVEAPDMTAEMDAARARRTGRRR